VFAPNSAHRARVTKARRGEGATDQAAAATVQRTPVERLASMRWAQRLRRMFNSDIETCFVCAEAMRIPACLQHPLVIEKILAHLDANAAGQASRPPAADCLDLGLAGDGRPQGTRRRSIRPLYPAYARPYSKHSGAPHAAIGAEPRSATPPIAQRA
jgi:hypothetical protein